MNKCHSYCKLSSLTFILLSHASIYPLMVNAQTANIANGTHQLSGQYELSNSEQYHSVVKITGANTVVTSGDDVSITVNGQGSAISLTNGSLTLTGSTIIGHNNTAWSSLMLINTNGHLNLSDIDLTTDTFYASGIQANGTNSVTTITNSRLKAGINTLSGQNGATLSVNGSQIDSTGNYGIIIYNNSNLSGENNVINMDGDVYSQAAIYALSNIDNSTSTLTLDDTAIHIVHGLSGVHSGLGGVINMKDLDVTGNVNAAVRSTENGHTEINSGSIVLDKGAIAMAQGTDDQNIATIKLSNVNAESNAIQNYYESTNSNNSLINGKAFSNIIIEGGSFHAKGAEQYGVSSMNDSSTISLSNTTIKTDTDKSIAIKSHGDITVKYSDVSTMGNYATALYSEAEITAQYVNISTIGNNASAVLSDRTGHVDIDHATVGTIGNNSSILEAIGNSSINANNLTATTTGENSHGVLLSKTGYYDRQSNISISNGAFTTSGNDAAGIATINRYNSPQLGQYQSNITLKNTSVVSDNGDGLYVKGMNTHVRLTDGSSLVAENGRLIYAEPYIFTGYLIPTEVNFVADSGTNLIGSVNFAEQSAVDMQLTASNWKILSSSKVSNLSNLDRSIIDLSSRSHQYNTLTVTGDYSGDSIKDAAINGKLIVNTVWDNNLSLSDTLDIAGTASGYTQVHTKNGIIGNVTRDNDKYSVAVVNVGNHQIGANSFYGFADTQGAGQAILVQKDSNSYAWYLPKINASNPEPIPNPEPTPNPQPEPIPNPEPTPDPRPEPIPNPEPTPDPQPEPIPNPEPIPDPQPDTNPPVAPNIANATKPEVPGFTLMPHANMEMGYRLITTLHERIGEQQTMAWDDCSQCQRTHNDGLVWGKMLGNLERTDGKDRYGYRSKIWGVRFGYDFDTVHNPENGSRRHAGIMLTYAKERLKFNDRRSVFFDTASGQYAEKNQRTGTGQTDTVALGAYSTYYHQNGSYLDLVGNFDYSYNQYNSNRNSRSTNNSYGAALSAEVGRPYAIAVSQWLIEPQTQLIYQYRTFSDFKTDYDVNIDQKDRHGLRGRAGFRLAYNAGTPELKTNTIYFVSNLVHDFVDNDRAIKIGTDSIKEKTPRTFSEVGGGLQLPVSETAYMYIDSRYTHSINNDHGKQNGVRGNFGFKYHW